MSPTDVQWLWVVFCICFSRLVSGLRHSALAAATEQLPRQADSFTAPRGDPTICTSTLNYMVSCVCFTACVSFMRPACFETNGQLVRKSRPCKPPHRPPKLTIATPCDMCHVSTGAPSCTSCRDLLSRLGSRCQAAPHPSRIRHRLPPWKDCGLRTPRHCALGLHV